MTVEERFRGVGIWSASLRWGDEMQAVEAAAELEELGYQALWIPDVGGDVFGALDRLLANTKSVPAATGILNLWMHTPTETADGYAELTARYGERLLLGIGVSHAPIVDKGEPGRYAKPLAAMSSYLDGLDTAATPLPSSGRVLAALGPKMLELSRDRSAGAHPYNVTTEHVSQARAILGPEALLLPELAAVLETDPARARQVAREHLAGYLNLPNYVNNWRRLGFEEDDLVDGGSDRLVDSVVAWGDEEPIDSKVGEYFDAGADHLALQMLGGDAFPLDAWRRLAPALNRQR